MQTAIIIYLCVINLATFVMFGIDKRRAVRQQYRISERQLYILIWLGWVLGALAGMQIFRHKRLKWSFMIRFVGITLVWIVVLVMIAIYW